MAPKRKSSDAGSASKPKRSRDVVPISERVKILGMIETNKKNPMRRLPGCMVRTNLPFVKWWTKKKIHVIQADPHISGFSFRGFSYPRVTAARKKNLEN